MHDVWRATLAWHIGRFGQFLTKTHFHIKLSVKKFMNGRFSAIVLRLLTWSIKDLWHSLVVRILKKRAWEMSRTSKVSRTFEFCFCFYSCWENLSKSLRAADKNKEKVEANRTGFSAEFFGSQSVEMFCFARKTKIQMLTTSSQSLTRINNILLNP